MRFLQAATIVLFAVKAWGADALPFERTQAPSVIAARIVGEVRDDGTGLPIPGAAVSLPDLERTAVSDSIGRYVLDDVPPGPQHLQARSLGYAPRMLHALVPRHGEVEINLSLTARPIRLQSILVRAPLDLPGSQGSPDLPDRDVPMRAIENHPLLNDPDAFRGMSAGEAVLDPEAPSGLHLRGGASDQTAYVLNGVPILFAYHAAGIASAWNPDAISRVRLIEALPSLNVPLTLSGAIDGETRAATDALAARGTMSTTQARVTIDTPVGRAGASALVGLRWGLPRLLRKSRESTYLHGDTGDRLAALDLGLGGGRLRVLGYDSDDEIRSLASKSNDPTVPSSSTRNVFEWASHSLGASWSRARAGSTDRAAAWFAGGEVASEWNEPAADLELNGDRADLGLFAAIERGGLHASTRVECRLERIQTRYRTRAAGDSIAPFALRSTTPLFSLSARRSEPLVSNLRLDLGARVASTDRSTRIAPSVSARWSLSPNLHLVATAERTHQFVQSLRNSESVVGKVFPVDLFTGADRNGVPVARSDRALVAGEYLPIPGARLSLQLYAVRSNDLLLVAPAEGRPFSTGEFAIGSSASHGAAAEAAWSATRWGALLNYGWQRVHYEGGGESYVPEHGALHRLEGGITLFPGATTSVRLGASAAFHRRTTRIPGSFEWESCNIADGGCEFVGSPDYLTADLGGTRLPPYFRVDLGARKHWHLQIADREATVELFATATNILGRRNVLTYARSFDTGKVISIEMRPRAPLVAGIDWRF